MPFIETVSGKARERRSSPLVVGAGCGMFTTALLSN